jgi:hypothetical protein
MHKIRLTWEEEHYFGTNEMKQVKRTMEIADEIYWNLPFILKHALIPLLISAGYGCDSIKKTFNLKKIDEVIDSQYDKQFGIEPIENVLKRLTLGKSDETYQKAKEVME